MQGRYGISCVAGLLMLFSGCSDDAYNAPKFQQYVKGEFQVMSEDIGYGYVPDLYVYRSWAIVVKHDMTRDLGVRLYDKETGKYVTGAIRRGRGPHEFINGLLLTSFDQDKGILAINETTRNVRILCDIDKLARGESDAVTEEEWIYRPALQYFGGLEDGKFLEEYVYSPIARDKANECRFVIQDSLSNELFRSNEYPALLSENSYMRWNLYNFSKCGMSPSKDRFAIATSYGAILETFDIVRDEVRKRSESYFVEPTIANDLSFTSKNTIMGFYDICATDEVIYTIYDGEHMGSAPAAERFNNIAVFDWNGKALKIYDMGMPIDQICLDPETGLMYAVVEDADRNCHLARCDLNVK